MILKIDNIQTKLHFFLCVSMHKNEIINFVERETGFFLLEIVVFYDEILQ